MINGRAIKFLFIGAFGIGTNYALLYSFAFAFSTDIKNMYVVVVSGILNTLLNYVANHYWAFRDRRSGVSFSAGGLKFFITTGLTIALYALLVWLFNMTGLDPRISVLIATVISFFPKYAMCYFWVWNGKNGFFKKPSKVGGV